MEASCFAASLASWAACSNVSRRGLPEEPPTAPPAGGEACGGGVPFRAAPHAGQNAAPIGGSAPHASHDIVVLLRIPAGRCHLQRRGRSYWFVPSRPTRLGPRGTARPPESLSDRGKLEEGSASDRRAPANVPVSVP